MTYEPTEAQMNAAYVAFMHNWSARTFHESIRAALIAAEKAAWRPIGEAPQDGTNTILANRMTVAVGKWARNDWRAMYFAWEGTNDFSAGAGLIYKPTHFRPLPPPPEQDQ
jgi:hypothetical protein